MKAVKLSELKQGARHMFDVPIGSYEVPVYESPAVTELECWGLAQCHPEYAIFIDPKVPRHQKRRTILHECIEVISDIYDLNLSE